MRYFLAFLLLLTFSCASKPVKLAEEIPVPKYTSAKDFQKILKDQVDSKNQKTIHIIFSADWCPSCAQLRKLLKSAGIEHKLIFVDVDRTWAFLLSRKIGVKGIPALAIIKKDKMIETRENPNKILVYLLANIEKDE